MMKHKLTGLQQDLLRYLFIKNPKSCNARDLARALQVSQPAISKSLPQLVKCNFIVVQKDKESKRLSIQLNRENNLVMQLKRADNVKQIYESELANFFFEECPSATIILFGSYATGEDTLTSDIDIAILGMKEKQLNCKKYEKILERVININFYDSLNTIDAHLRDNILNGIVIKGVIEYDLG